jgi:hypothetical protein
MPDLSHSVFMFSHPYLALSDKDIINNQRKFHRLSKVVSVDSGTFYLKTFPFIGDWTEHFGQYPYRKPTNASKWPLYCDV